MYLSVCGRSTFIALDTATQRRSAYCTFSAVWAKTTINRTVNKLYGQIGTD